MAALFKRTKKSEPKDELKNVGNEEAKSDDSAERAGVGSSAFSGATGTSTHRVLRGFYVSEKATMGAGDNQYVFRVFKDANKSEIKKEVSKLFNVKVKTVKVMNMPEKRRDFGKHPGSRSGFKKAIVVLREGYTIGQAKP